MDSLAVPVKRSTLCDRRYEISMVRHSDTSEDSFRLKRWCQCWSQVLVLAASLSAVLGVHAQGVVASAPAGASNGRSAEPLSIQVNDDRLTLALTKVPQVYLYGVIDADAPRRFEGLMKSRKIPLGSDIYLNSTGGDLNAGLALGRLFRSGLMVTHLGAPRLKSHSGSNGPRTSLCVDACTYAYLGGFYRWAVTGNDRIGLNPIDSSNPKAGNAGQPTQVVGELVAYLRDMGIDQAALTAPPGTPGNGTVWLSADQMLSSGLANNGHLPLTAKRLPSGGTSSLELSQMARDGEHRITFQCKPDGLTLTSHLKVGVDRARQLVSRGQGAYFQVDDLEMLPEQRASVDNDNQSMTINRPFPLSWLERLLSARSMGAWVSDRNGAVRYGFTLELEPVRNDLKAYYASCEQAAAQARTQKR
jgi:hypothetical protein